MNSLSGVMFMVIYMELLSLSWIE